MKYVSVDIETSGLDENKHQVLSFAAIIEDTKKQLPFEEIPKMHVYIKHNEIVGSPYAIHMNEHIIGCLSGRIQDNIEIIEPEELSKIFFDFLWKNHIRYETPLPLNQEVRIIDGQSYPIFGSRVKPIHVTVAGKNFGTFDKKFLELMPWWQKLIRIRQRILDPAIMYVDWENDIFPPGMEVCKERAGFKDTVVTHDALDDAWDVIQLLRGVYNK